MLGNEDSTLIISKNEEAFTDNILNLSNEFKTMLSKMDSDIQSLHSEVSNLASEIKSLKKNSLKFKQEETIKKKVSFFKLLKSQTFPFQIFFYILAIIGSLVAGCAMPLTSLLLGDVIDGSKDGSRALPVGHVLLSADDQYGADNEQHQKGQLPDESFLSVFSHSQL